MLKGQTHRFLVVGAVGLVVVAVALAGVALAQKAAPSITRYGPYYATQTMVAADGTTIERAVINAPPAPPPGYEVQRAPVSLPLSNPEAGTNSLTVPAYEWTFGCSATSGAMIAAYYDRNGYSNMYTGPTNGGVMPLDSSGWGTWAGNSGDPEAPYAQCPLAASRNGLDGRVIKGSIDDYYLVYNSSANDPYITGPWLQHPAGDAIGDYMWTSQSAAGNTDGSTSFYYYPSSTPLPCSSMPGLGILYDGNYGRMAFYQTKGYAVSNCYTQQTDNVVSGGFSFAQYTAEIDAGRPVMLQLQGHTIVGVGYNTTGNTVYLHDTWDYNTHSMTWGGTYSGMSMWAASIATLAPLSGARFYALTPCRLVDTRQSPDTAYTDGQTRTYNFNTAIPYTGTGACSTIPTAAALSLSVSFQVASHMAYLTAYPDDASLPTTATVVAYANGLFSSNTAIVPTGADNGIKVYAQYAGTVVIDINGYFK